MGTDTGAQVWLVNAGGQYVSGPFPSSTVGTAPPPAGSGYSYTTVAPASGTTYAQPSAGTPSCTSGYTADSSGTCTQYPDSTLVAGANSIVWSGTTAIPAEQVARIDSQILNKYMGSGGAAVPVNPGTLLAYMLGLGGSGSQGQTSSGSDGNTYTYSGGQWLSPALLPAAVAAATSPSTSSSAAAAAASSSSSSSSSTATAPSTMVTAGYVDPQGNLWAVGASGQVGGADAINLGAINSATLTSTAAQTLASAIVGHSISSGGYLYLDSTGLSAFESAFGTTGGLSSSTLLLIAAGVGALLLFKH